MHVLFIHEPLMKEIVHKHPSGLARVYTQGRNKDL